MPFAELDTTAIARSLSQIADRSGDLAEVFFERREDAELPAPDEPLGMRVWREEGFAVRLIRGGCTWLVARDRIDASGFADALRQVARVVPSAPYPEPRLRLGPFPPSSLGGDLLQFPRAATDALRRRLVAFPLELRIRSHRRWIRVVGPQLAPEPQSEQFFSYEATMPWGRHGALLSSLDEESAERVAASLTALFRARELPAVEAGSRDVLLGPGACAVLLHEVVAHALETDSLVLSGRPEAALGATVGSELLNVLDDPGGGPPGVRRATDDEGMMVVRRWLLREGIVEQLLADLFAAHRSPALVPGAGRRASRHWPPVPRSSHLELLPGETSLEDLLSDCRDGLFLPEASRGTLDPMTGRYSLRAPCGRRVRKGALGEAVGPCHLSGFVSQLLSSVVGVGDRPEPAGAGWCAKGGVRLPVWATAPALRLRQVEVSG